MPLLTLRLSTNNGPFARGIRLKTSSEYSHVDFVLPDGLFLGALPMPGVCIHKHEQPKEAFFGLELTEEQITQVLAFAKSQVGKLYDYSGIIGFAAHRDWQEDDRWFCSELVAASIQKIVPIFDEAAYFISPGDIATHPKLIRL